MSGGGSGLPGMARGDAWALGLLTLAWVAAIGVIGPQGDFPLNDDWAYAHTAKVLAETGRFDRLGWTWAPIVTHSLVGAAFAVVFGFSFEVLRASSLLMGWLGVVGSYALCRELSVSRPASAFAAATVAFNPIFLNLSYTFMTDVPFATLVTWSLVLLARGLRRGSWRWTALGLAVSVAATLSRQIGVAVPVAFGLALLATRWRELPRWSLPVGAAAAALALALVFSSSVFTAGDAEGEYPLSRYLADMLRRPGFATASLWNGFVAGVYLGVFAAPVVASRISVRARGPRVVAGLTLLLAPLVLQWLWLNGLSMPLGGNVLYDFGVGPATLSGAFDAVPHAPRAFWWGVTAAGVGSALLVLGWLALAVRRGFAGRSDGGVHAMLLLLPVVYLTPQVGSANFFDRYLLSLLPAVVALVSALPGPRPPPARVPAALLLAMLVVWSTFGTRDYLEHHRARWRLINALLERGIARDRIDGGFEFEGWRRRDADTGRYLERRGTYEDEFAVSPEAHIPGYAVLRSVRFRRWLPPGEEILRLHRREPRRPAARGSATPPD